MSVTDFNDVYENDDNLQKLQIALSDATGQSVSNIKSAISDRKKELRQAHGEK